MRILIRRPLSEDLETMFKWLNDRETREQSSQFVPVSWSDHVAWVQEALESSDREVFVIEQISTHELIGQIHVFGLQSPNKACEFSIRIGSTSHRNIGYGTESVTLLLEHLWTSRNIHRVTVHVFQENQRALRTYLKCGFEQEGILRDAALINGQWRNLIVMSVLNPHD